MINTAVRRFPKVLTAAKECWHYARMYTKYEPSIVWDRQMRGYLEDEMFCIKPSPLDKIRAEFSRIETEEAKRGAI